MVQAQGVLWGCSQALAWRYRRLVAEIGLEGRSTWNLGSTLASCLRLSSSWVSLSGERDACDGSYCLLKWRVWDRKRETKTEAMVPLVIWSWKWHTLISVIFNTHKSSCNVVGDHTRVNTRKHRSLRTILGTMCDNSCWSVLPGLGPIWLNYRLIIFCVLCSQSLCIERTS